MLHCWATAGKDATRSREAEMKGGDQNVAAYGGLWTTVFYACWVLLSLLSSVLGVLNDVWLWN